MDLSQLLNEIRDRAIDWAKSSWLDLGLMVDEILPDPLDPVALLPIATGQLCNTDSDLLVSLAATIVLIAVTLRIVDDSADRDNPQALYLSVGVDRSINAALSLSSSVTYQVLKLPLQPHRRQRLLDNYFSTFSQVCYGQDLDIRRVIQQLADYQNLVYAKTVSAYRFAAASAAYVGTDDIDTIHTCQNCGVYLGWMIQILDDIEAMWFPDGPSDLACGRLTFPLLYGLSLERPQVQELKRLCAEPDLHHGQILALLDEMQVRVRLVEMALDYRDQALNTLATQPRGYQILETWLDWLWRDGNRLAT